MSEISIKQRAKDRAADAMFLFTGTIATVTIGPINTAVKIAATVVSLFIPAEAASTVHLYAKEGLAHCLPSDWLRWAKPSFELSNLLCMPYAFILNLIPLVKIPKKEDSLGNKFQKLLFEKALSLTESEYSIVSEGASRLAFFGATLLITVAKVAQLGLALFATALSLLTSGGFLGCWKGINAFAKTNLKLDILETLCDGLRYTFEPSRPKEEGYLIQETQTSSSDSAEDSV